MRSPWHTTWSGEVFALLLYKGHHCDYRPQIFGGHGHQRYCYSITEGTAHNVAYTPIQCAYIMQACDRSTADWLSHHNCTEGKDQEMGGMNINMHTFSMAINVPVCTSVEDIRNAMSTDIEL